MLFRAGERELQTVRVNYKSQFSRVSVSSWNVTPALIFSSRDIGETLITIVQTRSFDFQR